MVILSLPSHCLRSLSRRLRAPFSPFRRPCQAFLLPTSMPCRLASHCLCSLSRRLRAPFRPFSRPLPAPGSAFPPLSCQKPCGKPRNGPENGGFDRVCKVGMRNCDRFSQKSALFLCISLRGADIRRTFALAIGTQATLALTDTPFTPPRRRCGGSREARCDCSLK